MQRSISWLAAVVAVLATATPVLATPVATDDLTYTAFGRVFPDPLAGCQAVAVSPCSPNAQGNVPATQFIQYPEFLDALKFMSSKPQWARYMEVLVLDGKLGEGSGTTAGNAMFPGNNLQFLEWTPKPEYVSAGLPTSTLERKKSDLIVVRVTDETVPDAGKKRYTLSLSIHGIERAGAEGGIRAMEDLVTAHTTGKHDDAVLPAAAKPGAPTFEHVLDKTIIYFTLPNPDGWRRGDVTELGAFYQRYNGNGVDPNRDWPDIGYSFRPYSGGSEPETRAFLAFYRDVQATTRSGFAAGDDLHGQPLADALSYTLLPHGRHDYGKDLRIREAAKTINRAQYHATKWSPIIQDNDQPTGGAVPCTPTTTLGPACSKIYAQTWGSVYDTINYTTTGTLGDWFDSSIGLNADGIDNEMSFSHLDKNIVFDPHTEQLHVDGNKAIIYAHAADLIAPASGTFAVPGRKGYVAGPRLVRARQVIQGDAPKKTVPQDDYVDVRGTADPAEGGQTVIPFTVFETKKKGKTPGIYNGGMRVDVTTTNVQGIGTGLVTLRVQCRGCDRHVGVDESDDGWVTVGEDFNQSFVYAQSGITVAVNRPQGSEKGTDWRAVVSQGSAITRMDVDFTSGPATTDGATGGDEPPVLEAYDVANTDFFTELNRFIPDKAARFQAVDPAKVIGGTQSLAGLDTLVLADDPLPGYTGTYAGEPSGGPSSGRTFEDTKITFPSQGPTSCIRSTLSVDQHDFVIAPEERNASVRVRIAWADPLNDWDLYLRYLGEDGVYRDINSSTDFNFETGDPSEEVEVANPAPGAYRIEVVNCTALDSNYTGELSFAPADATTVGTFTTAQKDAWMAALRTWVEGGGNLVLSDGALRALPELTNLPATIELANPTRREPTVKQQTVYAGQLAFATGPGATETSGPNTLGDPLAGNVKQPGARFNTGMRRQTFEPTPLGFSIQNAAGSDAAGSPQFDVSRSAWEGSGGRTAATSADGGARNAQSVYNRVALGEIAVGAGTVRIVGALLPQPSTENDHPLGIEPYAVTYTGYILVANLVTP